MQYSATADHIMPNAPIDYFDSIFFKQLLFYQQCVGVAPLDPNFRVRLPAIFFVSLTATFMLCNFYTIAVFDTTTRLKCLTGTGLGLQGSAKYPTIIWYAKDMYALTAFLRTIYERNRLRVLPAYGVLQRWVEVSDIVGQSVCSYTVV